MAAPKHIADASFKIDEYLETLPEWSQKICKQLRKIVLKSDPKIIEDWKWGPNYYLEGMVCGYAGFQKQVVLVFFKGSLLQDKKKLLNHNEGSENTRNFKFTDVKQIDEDIILEYIIEAIDLNKNGRKVISSKNRTVEIAKDVKKEFKQAAVLSYFEKQSYSHRKEYVRWIGSAKKEETRKSRIGKAIVMLKKKEMMLDKYKK